MTTWVCYECEVTVISPRQPMCRCMRWMEKAREFVRSRTGGGR